MKQDPRRIVTRADRKVISVRRQPVRDPGSNQPFIVLHAEQVSIRLTADEAAILAIVLVEESNEMRRRR